MKKARRFADGLVRSWSGRRGSNPRPRPWQGRALPAEPRPHRRGNIILEVSVARNPRFQKSSQKYFRNLSLMVGELLVDYLLADAENFQSSKHSWAISSGGEHYLDTVGVTSSNLVSPTICGHGSVGRAQPCQGWGRGFEPRCPLQQCSGPVS